MLSKKRKNQVPKSIPKVFKTLTNKMKFLTQMKNSGNENIFKQQKS